MRFSGMSLALVGLAASLAACGSKTGLETPDVEQPDVVDATDVHVPDPRICLQPNPDGGLYHVNLQTNAQVAVADVLFVIDRTGSMDQEIDNVRQGLRTVIVPGLIRAIPDLHLGLVTYADFPVDPYGSPDDRPFTLERALSGEFTALQGAIGNVRANGGGDNPESMVESLYQIATGEGLAPYVQAAGGCASVGLGYACFRPRAQPVIVLIADAPSHNGAVGLGDNHAYDRTSFAPFQPPHTYEQMITQLTSTLHPRVIGINSGLDPFSGRRDLEQLARDTGTLGSNGSPLVFDIGPDGSGLSEQVVSAIQRLTAEVRLGSVSARAVDDGSGGALLVRGVRPVSATPMGQIDRFDDTTFYNVLPGTQLQFELDLDPNLIVPGPRERTFTVHIEFLADGRPTLGTRDVVIVIPARGEMCPTS